uniref:Uncharacterized protein n=1 Tax=CrAss-like virus sp. ctcfK29 TaxID=2826827 RepID=A0A8S5MJ17_9CAUD|nr:MAG TPA: hypothetical protein [CrAss-like virus sp. ctcfK29]DAG88021.1 MAG TPA: hypothetical protein [Crassvirales sp.]DAK84558.1 MAG TPA: hypothetical protein [Caudoviricetes sp.]DAG91651.1 MAG TPA: hypothetical protein [Crassvirales sp.]DAM84430.1 MAG TPA: hypothetical protein [Caudoviricetes sp.]
MPYLYFFIFFICKDNKRSNQYKVSNIFPNSI